MITAKLFFDSRDIPLANKISDFAETYTAHHGRPPVLCKMNGDELQKELGKLGILAVTGKILVGGVSIIPWETVPEYCYWLLPEFDPEPEVA